MLHHSIFTGALLIVSTVNAQGEICNRIPTPLDPTSIPPEYCSTAPNPPPALLPLGPVGPFPGCGTAFQISPSPSLPRGTLQFEYSYPSPSFQNYAQTTLDLSDVDGAASGTPREPISRCGGGVEAAGGGGRDA